MLVTSGLTSPERSVSHQTLSAIVKQLKIKRLWQQQKKETSLIMSIPIGGIKL